METFHNVENMRCDFEEGAKRERIKGKDNELAWNKRKGVVAEKLKIGHLFFGSLPVCI